MQIKIIIKYKNNYIQQNGKMKNLTIPSTGKDMEQLEIVHIAGGKAKQPFQKKKKFDSFYYIKHAGTI